MSKKYNLSSYQEYIHKSRYARWLDKEKRRETWEETVDRYIKFFYDKIPNSKDALELREAILSLNVMPSMRCLMTAGEALERDHIAGYNCSYLPVDHPRAFDEAMYILMCGTGVGFSVERQFISKLPDIAEEFYETETVIQVRDSKMGWACALRELISLLYSGRVPRWDISRVRPAGARLKTFGGRASGPEPLERLFRNTVTAFKKAAGRKLNSIECHDLMCWIADTVVVGGVRRSACISLSNLTDDRMRRAKYGEWYETQPQRRLANNSVAYTERPDFESYLSEWVNLYKSKSGERGIVNRVALKKKCDSIGRDSNYEFGVNPCFHGDTLIDTVEGRRKISDITESTYVYSMDSTGSLCIKKASASFVTKIAPVIEVKFTNGSIKVTEDHKIYTLNRGWVEAAKLKEGDKLNPLTRQRRGAAYCGVKLGSEDKSSIRMEHRLVWESVNGCIEPECDVHHIDGDTYNNSINNLEMIHHSTHSSLTRYSCDNNHQVKDNVTGRFTLTEKSKKQIKPLPEHLKSNLHQYCVVVEITQVSSQSKVYDITVEDTHCLVANGIVAHNCGEIILRPNQFCNLTEVVVRPEDSLDVLKNKVRLATILGTLQATLTNFRYLRKVWQDNTEEERLLGVSLTGIMDHYVMCGYDGILIDWLKELKQVAKETNIVWAKKLGISPATAITCVKPSGTVSQLVNSSSGMHTRQFKYYIRRVQNDIKDPLTKVLITQGVPYTQDSSVYYFNFPMKSPDSALTAKDISALEQLELWKKYQEHWCDHNPSQSIYYEDNDFMGVGQWVWDNFDTIGGLSFFQLSNNVYDNSPYVEITKEEYERLVKEFPKEIDFDKLSEYEKEDNTTGMQEFSCSGGQCEL